MSYDHSLTIEARLKNEVPQEQALEAISPLLEHFAITGDVFENGCDYSDFEFHFVSNTISIYTAGDVGDSFCELVHDVTDKLGPLTENTGIATLKNFDTPDLDNAITTIVFGNSPEAVKRAELNSVLEFAMFKFGSFLPKESIGRIRECIERETAGRSKLHEIAQVVVFASGGITHSVAIREMPPDGVPCIVVDYDDRHDDAGDISPEDFERKKLGISREELDKVVTYIW